MNTSASRPIPVLVVKQPTIDRDFELPAIVAVQGPTFEPFLHGTCLALRSDGMTINIGTTLASGTQVSIHFALPSNQETVRVRAFVRHQHNGQHQVEFITENDNDYRVVKQIEDDLGRRVESLKHM